MEVQTQNICRHFLIILCIILYTGEICYNIMSEKALQYKN